MILLLTACTGSLLECAKRVAGLKVIPVPRSLKGRFDAWSNFSGAVRGEAGTAAPDTDAIFCGSDQLARGASDALRLLGRRVPDDIALVGFDNWEPMALGADPPLTSIDMCLEDVGRKAGEILLAAIDGATAHGVTTVPCRLVVRASTAAPTEPSAPPSAEPPALTATVAATTDNQQSVVDA